MEQKKIIRVYADTSVYGGVFDEEFDHASKAFFEAVRQERFQLSTSELVRQELQAAPTQVEELFVEMLAYAEITEINSVALELQDAYIESNVVSQKYATDALHVALATVAQVSLIVSWNFKHIVHFEKIPRYNAVNVLCGYREISIFSPLEVVADENQDV